MAPCKYKISFLIILTLTVASAEQISPPVDSHSSRSATSFYDVLKSNGLPIGLFPKGISNFTIDRASGRFELHLLSPSPCDTKFETRVRYEWNITGSVNYGKIANLSGVATQELFLWLPVKNIQVDIPSSGLIYFDVGVISKQFSLSFFETPRDCNAMAKVDSGESYDVVLLDNLGRIVEDRSRNYVRNLDKSFKDEELRAVS
ncbi:hypothetical protein ACJIZ3_023127 [Penstemon smallii]|uniref:Uncharacterized protein n=1 Tax=Penstemon smallii TaxID=265156 RepID=A0ABD3TN77_9LAMI